MIQDVKTVILTNDDIKYSPDGEKYILKIPNKFLLEADLVLYLNDDKTFKILKNRYTSYDTLETPKEKVILGYTM